jgi:hypothetical protein
MTVLWLTFAVIAFTFILLNIKKIANEEVMLSFISTFLILVICFIVKIYKILK